MNMKHYWQNVNFIWKICVFKMVFGEYWTLLTRWHWKHYCVCWHWDVDVVSDLNCQVFEPTVWTEDYQDQFSLCLCSVTVKACKLFQRSKSTDSPKRRSYSLISPLKSINSHSKMCIWFCKMQYHNSVTLRVHTLFFE